MRVHPSALGSKFPKHKIIVGVVLVVALIGVPLFTGKKEVVVQAPVAPVEKRIDVVIARDPIEPGQPLDKANLVLEQRSINTLPADVITSFDVLKNKVAAGPIPARYPLSMAFLADPVTTLPQVSETETQKPEDPIETLLKEIEKDTVALPINFSSDAPPRGSRLAITLAKGRGESILVIDDCWVSKASGKDATLRLEPAQGLILQSAKSYGSFNFMVLPFEGPSPYLGKGVASEEELKKLVEGNVVQVKDRPRNQAGPIGRAWISDDPSYKLGVFSDGTIKPLGE